MKKTLLTLLLLLLAGSARADMDVNIVQHLSFGSFLLINNNAVHSITVTPQGNKTYSPQLVPSVQAQEGIYQLQGFNADADLSVLIDPVVVPITCVCGSGPDFTIDNFQVEPPIPHTDPAGNATIKLGARLRTDGSHAPYRQSAYTGQLSIIVNN